MSSVRVVRSNRILQSLSPQRRAHLLKLKKKIVSGAYALEGKLELIVDELIDEVVKMRN